MSRPKLTIDWSSRNEGNYDTTGMGLWKSSNAIALYAMMGNPNWISRRFEIGELKYRTVVNSLAEWISPGGTEPDEWTDNFARVLFDSKVKASEFQWSETPHADIGPFRFLRVHPILHSLYTFLGIANLAKLDSSDFDEKTNTIRLTPEKTSIAYNQFWSFNPDYEFSQLLDFLKRKSAYSGVTIIVPGGTGKRKLVCCAVPDDVPPLQLETGRAPSPPPLDFDPDNPPTFTILYGPPGTGKTTIAKQRAHEKHWQCNIVQFHASYNYEDFIEGIRPVTFPDGELRYDIVEGPLKIIAHKATSLYPAHLLTRILIAKDEVVIQLPTAFSERYELKHVELSESKEFPKEDPVAIRNDSILLTKDQAKKRIGDILEEAQRLGVTATLKKLYVKDASWGSASQCLILDEINRANISQVLGELIYVLADQDSIKPNPVRLQYSGEEFRWPGGLNLIGTMNTADASTERLDQAIKRRFTLEPIPPNPDLFGRPASEFGFLEGYCDKHKGNPYLKLKPINNLNDLFVLFGAGISPEKLLRDINSKILNDTKKKYGVIHPNDKLIGHSYFLKLCRKLCKYEPRKDDWMPQCFWNEAVPLFWHEITPALLSVFNHDEKITHAFYEDLLSGTKIEKSLFSASFYESFVESIFFKAGTITEKSIDEFAKVHPILWRKAS